MIIGEQLKRGGFEQGVIEGVQQGIKQSIGKDVIARYTEVSLKTLKP